MATSLFADGVSNIFIADGAVRIQLVTTVAVDQEKSSLAPAGTMVLTIPAFLKMHDQMGQLVKKMLDDGVLKRNPEAAEPKP